MNKLTAVELNKKTHNNLKIKNGAVLKNIAEHHLITLRAIEISQASVCFPVFANKNTHNKLWTFSALTSFIPNQNLFVKDNKFETIFRPASTQTYPFFLMKAANKENEYTVGILEGHSAFSKTTGEALFDKNGEPTAATSNRVQMLEEGVLHDAQTAQFGLTLEKLGLFQELDMNLQALSGEKQTLKGLHTINEDRLQSLPAKDLELLHKEGYLKPLYAMITSLVLVNKLIALNNEDINRRQLTQVQMIPIKDAAVSQ